MPTGTCKWFNSKKGFGFLVPDIKGPDIFVHVSALEKSGLKSLTDGQRISFELAPDREGRMCACDLRVMM